MQTAGDLVGRGVKLAAGVQLGQHHLHCRIIWPLGKASCPRECPAVVDHGDRIVHVNHDIDLLGVARQSLVTELSTTSYTR